MSVMFLLAAIFLPLYPFSALHNLIFQRLPQPALRALLLLVWPQLGVSVLAYAPTDIPDVLLVWAVASAGFYALRLLTVRDLGLWAAMLASSALALTWWVAAGGVEPFVLRLFALGFSVPALLLVLLAGQLTRRFGAAYAGLSGGLASSHPRLAGVLVVGLLAATATPVFPGFFSMLALFGTLGEFQWGLGLALLVIWLLWSWAAVLLLQGFIAGSAPAARDDLGAAALAGYTAVLIALVAASLLLTGGQL